MDVDISVVSLHKTAAFPSVLAGFQLHPTAPPPSLHVHALHVLPQLQHPQLLMLMQQHLPQQTQEQA